LFYLLNKIKKSDFFSFFPSKISYLLKGIGIITHHAHHDPDEFGGFPLESKCLSEAKPKNITQLATISFTPLRKTDVLILWIVSLLENHWAQ